MKEDIGICTMRRTTVCCLNTLLYFSPNGLQIGMYFHLLRSAAKVAFFNGKKEGNPRKFEGKFKENAHNEGQCVAFWKNALAFELKCKYVLIKT